MNAIHNKRQLSDESRQTIYRLDAGYFLLRMNVDREVVLYV
ncbi:hypothetical protein [Paenibacillus guangzhouensis]|nr:hypothetical protein [Paenibacillus guangzhouensis]